MLAYVPCKTEGRRIKNKIEFAKWKRTNLVGRDLQILEYMKGCRCIKKEMGVSFPVG